MGWDSNPNGPDLLMVTVVLQYGVFATHPRDVVRMGFARVLRG